MALICRIMLAILINFEQYSCSVWISIDMDWMHLKSIWNGSLTWVLPETGVGSFSYLGWILHPRSHQVTSELQPQISHSLCSALWERASLVRSDTCYLCVDSGKEKSSNCKDKNKAQFRSNMRDEAAKLLRCTNIRRRPFYISSRLVSSHVFDLNWA